MRVLLLHNRYREPGGEERLVETISALLREGGFECRQLVRNSRGLSRLQAGVGMLRGGLDPAETARQIGDFRPDVVHAHNINPAIGYRALAAAKSAGAKTVMHLHNFRIFCAIGTSYRDGRPCFRCQGRNTWPGVRLRCRGAVAESVVYGLALTTHQKALLDCVDRFITPSTYAAEQLLRLGLSADRLTVLANPAPKDALVEHSNAAKGKYALYVGRLSSEKGVDTALVAAEGAGVPLKVVGGGLEDGGKPSWETGTAHFVGKVTRAELVDLRAGAAMALVPSRGPEVFPFAALEAMAAGLPVLASRVGGLPEIVGPEQTLTPGDAAQWTGAVAKLMESPKRRKHLGEGNLAKIRSRFSEAEFAEKLKRIYEQL